jgi:hypothetical protein
MGRIFAELFERDSSESNVCGAIARPAPPPPDGGTSPLRGEDFVSIKRAGAPQNPGA